MIPKINFVWSFIYQEEIHLVKDLEYDRLKSESRVSNFIKEVETEGGSVGKKTLYYMEEITGLKWKKPEINCYVLDISLFGPISDPLTIPISLWDGDQVHSLSVNRFVDMLIHELIHNLFIQNESKSLDKFFVYLINKYKNENVAIHVPVHAIHKEIFLKIFGVNRLKEEIKMCDYYPEYKESWEIVNKDGSNNIINLMKEAAGLNE